MFQLTIIKFFEKREITISYSLKGGLFGEKNSENFYLQSNK